MTATTTERDRLNAIYLELTRVTGLLEKLHAALDHYDTAVAWRDSRLMLVDGNRDDVLPHVLRAPGDALFHAVGPAWCLQRSCDALIELAGASLAHADMARYHRGLRLIAVEIIRAFSDGRDLDAAHLRTINRGLKILGKRMDARAVADVRHYLAENDRQQAEWRACGMGWAADKIERDPQCRRLLESLREFVGELPEGQLY